MTRDMLNGILAEMPGMDIKDGRFEVEENHLLNFYIGQPGKSIDVKRAIVNGSAASVR